MLLVAIHGILTRQTDASWPDHFDAWMRERHPEVKVLKKEYAAGPFPRWNCWWKNPRLARGLAAELQLFPRSEPLWLVAHSNGANIALLTLPYLLAARGRVTGLLLTGAACPADIERNGVAGWLAAGRLSHAIAYCAPNDGVLPGNRGGNVWGRLLQRGWTALAWPYGELGRTGWRSARPLPAACRIRWFAEGHSGYFAPGRREATFERIWQDVGEAE